MNILVRLFSVSILLTVGSALTAASAPSQLSQIHLSLNLTLDYDRATMRGEAALTLENTGAGSADIVPLQIGRLLNVSEVLSSDGKSIPFTQDVLEYDDWPEFQVNQIILTLQTPIEPNETRSFRIQYDGVLVGYTETGMLYVQDRIDTSFTILRSDARAFPIVATPSIAELRAQPRKDFTFDARITVPTGFTVATGVAEKVCDTVGDFVTWVFESTERVPFLNIAIAPYVQIVDGGIRVFHFPADRSGAATVMSSIKKATALYAEWFGHLSDSVRLHVIEIPTSMGSQASLTGGIIQTADAFRDSKQLTHLYHELSHLWNVEDLDRPSCRWNEGMAMFLQQRVAIELDGAEALDTYMEARAESRRELLKERPDLLDVPLIEYGEREMTDYSYRTGQLMFYVLYRVMGAAKFDQAYRGFLEANRVSGSTTEEFANHFRQDASADVDRVLTDWLFTTGWAQRLGSGETLEWMIARY